MAENWIAYMGRIEEETASFIVDLDAGESYDITDYPVRIEVTLPFTPGPEDGLPDKPALDKLNDAEDRCVEALRDQVDAVHVGHATRPGRRWVLLYAPTAVNIEAAAKGAVAGASVAGATVETVEDEDWSAYFDFLFPTPTEFQWLGNRQLVDQLEAQGDALATPRLVQHAAYFTSEDGRDAYAAAVAELGFTLGERGIDDREEVDELPYSLKFSRSHAVDMETITEITMPLVELAVEHDGVYDGWETPLTPE